MPTLSVSPRSAGTMLPGRAIHPVLVLAAMLWSAPQMAGAADVTPGFLVQTAFIDATFPGDAGASVAVGGRDADGRPVLALLQLKDGRLQLREVALPADAVAIDSGPIAGGADAVFILCSDRVLRLDGFSATPAPVADTESLYRGRSFAELSATIDFARDVTGDGVAELLIQDFDGMHVHGGERYALRSTLQLPSIRRGYDRVVTYRPVRIAAAAGPTGPELVSIRGNELAVFATGGPGFGAMPDIAPIELGLSEEREIEAYYNGYDNIDQSQFELREPELLHDINADSLPDLITLQTVSRGVFDKESIYRIHLARRESGRLTFAPEPDAILSGRGYQFGIQAETLGEDRLALVSPSVRIGLRAIIGALFSRSVTLQIAIHTPDAMGDYVEEPSTVVKSKVRFDFGSGQVEFPTIEFGDLDGDGHSDLVLKTGGDELVWRRNRGDGQFDRDDRELDLVAPADGTAVHTVDMDGDGRAEVIVRYGSGDDDALNGLIRVLPSVR